MWVLIAGCAGLFSWWLTGRLAAGTSMIGSMDHPNDRSLHTEPTPRSGGVAILAGVILGLLAAAVGFAGLEPQHRIVPKDLGPSGRWIAGSIALVAAVSFLDDRRGLPVGLRFMAQAMAALIVVWGAGLGLPEITIPGIGSVAFGWIAGPVSVIFLIWMTNLYNFMDGMDGFAGGMTTVGFGFLAYFGWRAGYPFTLFIAALVSMSALGFLLHNFPPARIFMGDVGSIPIGFAAGTIILGGVRDGLFDFWVPILVFSPFIMDATVTIVRRAWRGHRIWEAHREHFYQRVVLSGWSHRRTVLAEYVVMLCCGGLAVLYQEAGEDWRPMILGVWALMFTGLFSTVNRLERRGEISGRL